jgi:RimJ/RimL family protein N-acetyltransferase
LWVRVSPKWRGFRTAIFGEVKGRPIYGRAASDNLASIEVLLKGGFVITGSEKSYANGRGEEIEETLLVLE